MRNGRTRIARTNAWRLPVLRAVALALLWPFACFSLVQADTMLASDANGRITMILCGSDLPVDMAVAPDGTVFPVSELDRHRELALHGACDWAPHAQALHDSAPAALPAPVALVHPFDPGRTPRGPAVSLAPLPPVARGPPASV
ncbi:hypothetical protein [Paracoccus broussonetiae]|uniref:DUF2946 domain-containing protein n=1 Tax=Paracoccus broussonetiae subsp. drimophilus TaxID=3373869 RepID=A0ABW7LP42_9RHOB